MPVQIDGKTWVEVRPARADGTLVKMAEARVWDGEAWKIVWQGKDAYERLNPTHYYRLNGDLVNMGSSSTSLSVNSSRATVGAEYLTYNNYNGARYVEITNLPAGNTGDSYTVSMWMKPINPGEYPAFFARGTGSSNAIDVYYNSQGQVSLDDYGSNNGVAITAPYVLNQWQHYVFNIAHETTSRTRAGVWYNGQPMGSSTFNTGSRHAATHSLKIGSDEGGEYSFRGDLDTLAYFDRTLTDEEVLSIYNAGRL